MFKIVSLLSVIALASAGGQEQHLLPPSPIVSTLGGHTLLSSRLVAPSLLSRVVGPSVLSLPAVAHQHVTLAQPSAVAVERVSVGSVPSYSVVNEPTTIVTPGKTIRGHSFTSEVRHDSIARLAAPVYAYAAPVYASPAIETVEAVEAPAVAKVVEAPEVSEVVETKSLAAPVLAPAQLTSDVLLRSALPSHYVSAPQVYATGAAQVLAGPASVKGYTRETGRTELVNELRLRAASIPATIVHDSLVESVPTLLSQPLLTKTVLSSPYYSTLIKK